MQSYLAAQPQREMHTDSPTLLQPLLYYDAGFGFSEKDTLLQGGHHLLLGRGILLQLLDMLFFAVLADRCRDRDL